jgi:inner membrane protein
MGKAGVGKALGLAAVGMVLLTALARIDGLAHERQQRQWTAQEEVARDTAGSQLLTGPYLQRHCTETWTAVSVSTDDKGQRTERRTRESRDFTRTSTPALLRIGGDVQPQVLERGLFKVNTYQAQLQLLAQWDSPDDLADLQGNSRELEGKITCQPIEALLQVSDARGLRSVVLQLDGQALKVLPAPDIRGAAVPRPQRAGAYPSDPSAAPAEAAEGSSTGGLRAWLPDTVLSSTMPLKLDLQLELLGTESLHFTPAAAQVHAALRSAWPHPSFQGRFLPAEREVADSGFSAQWRINELAARAGAALRQGERSADRFGVALVDPVNPYTLSDRALKYAFLFIGLTLGAVLLAELLGSRRLHPVQYGFVGLALALFFLLLLALSEHLAFGLAYAVAAGSASLLLGHYGSSLFGSARGGVRFGAGMLALYGVLYVVLNLEKAALLLGAVLLFAVLALAMGVTRKLDWYGLGEKLGESLSPKASNPMVKPGSAVPGSAAAS